MDIKGMSAFITGGGSGMGKATAYKLASLGAKVSLVDINATAVQEVAAEISGIAIVADITDETSMQAALEKSIQAHGVPRINVNCAGILTAARICGKQGAMPLADFKRVIDINLVGTFNVMRLLAYRMTAIEPVTADGERGIIINTASIAAFEGQLGQVAYSASKGGVSSMTLPAARELAKFGIRVVTIAPGLIQTPMLAVVDEKVYASLVDSTIFPKRLGLAGEYANFVVHLITNALLNGDTYRLDGAVRLK